MKLGDGLFLNTFRKVAEDYKLTGIVANDMIVDNTCVSLHHISLQCSDLRIGPCSSLRDQASLM